MGELMTSLANIKGSLSPLTGGLVITASLWFTVYRYASKSESRSWNPDYLSPEGGVYREIRTENPRR